jgi:ribosomal protein S18 acetylase RimI-like enzyme
MDVITVDAGYGKLEELASFLADSFEDDSFYRLVEGSKLNRKEIIINMFKNTIKACIHDGYVHVVEDNGSIIAASVWADYHGMHKKNHKGFNQIFDCDKQYLLSMGVTKNSALEIVSALKEIGDSQEMSDYRDIYYLVAVAVKDKYRRKGIAYKLLSRLMDSIWNAEFHADVFNLNAMPLYERCGFSVGGKFDFKGKDFYNIRKKAKDGTAEHTSISIYLPVSFDMKKVISRHPDKNFEFNESSVKLEGFKEVKQGELSFLACSPFSECEVKKITFNDTMLLTAIEQVIDMPVCEQRTRYEGSVLEIIYVIRNDKKEKPFDENYKSFPNKYDGVTNDCYTLIPATYGSYKKITDYCKTRAVSQQARYVLTNLEFRQAYECGTSSSNPYDYASDIALSGKINERVERFVIGNVNLILKDEFEIGSNFKDTPEIGRSSNALITITIDKLSNCAVVMITQISNSLPLSFYLDGIISQQVLVESAEGTENIFHFLRRKLDISISGTPKSFLTIPENAMLDKRYLASLLLGEIYYEPNDGIGNIIDSEINSILNNENGSGQYDYAKVYAYRNIIINITKCFSPVITKRIEEECITVLFLEMIAIYEAALCYANSETVRILTNRMTSFKSRNDYLNEVNRVNLEYGKTIAFWDTKFRFPSSQKSVEMLTNAFKISELRDVYNRNINFVTNTLDVQANIVDYDESSTLNFIIILLTITQVISAFSAFYGIAPGTTFENIHKIPLLLTITLPLIILKLRKSITLRKMKGIKSHKKY